MSEVNSAPSSSPDHASAALATLIAAIPPGRRPAVLQCVASCRACETIEESFSVGPLRAAFADLWERTFQQPLPFNDLRRVLNPPVPIKTVLAFSRLMLTEGVNIDRALHDLVRHLHSRVLELRGSPQLHLFEQAESEIAAPNIEPLHVGESVRSLDQLVREGRRFPAIYADPPWQYSNAASRAAAENHYPTMSLDAICAEPVRDLAANNAHLHLWTTNGFLRDAFEVINAWGFSFKSCLVWIKDEIGMGNYWRVSHEFLLLGVRGNLTFRDRTLPSWIRAPRTAHSRKPGVVRTLIERVSPGPYLELYGREELPNSAWTVYGNQVERRLF
jgi:N6-adenosine-specific RNA methylase IME4